MHPHIQMASKDDNTSNGSNSLSMKLLVDTKVRRALYAEAGKDVVDFLFSLLALPPGTVGKLAADSPVVGSVGNLYGSARSMDARNPLLPPAGGHGDARWSLPDVAEQSPTKKGSRLRFFRCNEQYYQDCCDYIAEASGMACPVCGHEMASGLEIVRKDEPANCSCRGCGNTVTYTIKDDLSVAPMSTISGICLLGSMGVTSIAAPEEKIMPLGYKEGLEILKASLHSKTVLTDAFLGNVGDKMQNQK